MGGVRRNRKRNRNRARDRIEGSQTENKDERKPYKEILRENNDFMKYYKAQNLMGEEDWPRFLEAMRTDLPTAFRITGCSRQEASHLLSIVKGEFFERLVNPGGGEEGNSEVPLEARRPFALPWYPNELGWQVKISRKDIRRSEGYFRLHNFLTQETSCGAISRQETVSMIPPLVLDVRSHHKVLDMCAAPGSKTAQLIEYLHSDSDKTPDGFVIANDVDNGRCYMLVHQAKRLNSPCIAIMNHEAGAMPNLVMQDEEGKSETVKFDRVLCDVPCSGDGTLRKNPDIWPKWNTANANNLHGVQYRVVKRGLEMLAVGGRLVYSTCSLNPVENEAVVARILGEAGDSVELVDVSDRLPGLQFERGLETWKPASKDLTLYDSYDQVDEKWQTQVRPSMFPPPPDAATKVPFEKCLRILPHHQDTGGFFVAALEKKKALPWEAGSAAGAVQDQPAQVPDPPRKKRKTFHGYREDPYVFFGPNEPVWKSIRDFYDIGDGLDSTCLLTRCLVGKKKNVYFVSPKLKATIIVNQSSVKIINTGVKVFARCDNKSMTCSFRLVQEGLESIEKFVGSTRRLKVPKEEMIEILYKTDPANPLDIDQLSEETKNRIEKISQGSCILEYVGDDLNVTVVGWRGAKSVRAYIPLSDAIHYLRLLGASVDRFEVNKFKKENGEKPPSDVNVNGGDKEDHDDAGDDEEDNNDEAEKMEKEEADKDKSEEEKNT